MKWITSAAAAAMALLALSGCDKKTSDDLKEKAEDAKQTVEAKTKEAKEAADKQIEKAKPKLKEFGEKAKDRKSTRLNSSHSAKSRMPSSA